MRITILLMISIAVVACQPQSGEEAQQPPESDVASLAASAEVPSDAPAAVRTEIDRVREAWIEAVERDDAAAIAQLYVEDGVIIDPIDYVPVRGRQAIEKVLLTELPMIGKLELRSQDFYASGDLAYDYGEFSERVTPPGAETVRISGQYLLILRRQEDGQWKLVKKIAMISPRRVTQGGTQ